MLKNDYGFKIKKSDDKILKDPESWRSGKNSHQRGYTYKWQKYREKFLFENPLCLYCERKSIVTVATVVDHIIPHKGDQKLFWSTNNHQPLCKRCHDSDKQIEEKRGF